MDLPSRQERVREHAFLYSRGFPTFLEKLVLSVKKVSIAVAVSAALAASAAHAQSSVTLYGLVDAGITYTNNVGGSGRVALVSGNISGSRFGLRGSEDLGGGLKTIFVLENGFNVNNGTLGQGGRMFGRQAYVGLSSKCWRRHAGPPV